MEAQKDRRTSRPYTFPDSLHDRIEQLSARRTKHNRSALAEQYIRLGMAAEAAGWAPPEGGGEPQAAGGAQ